jgi:hypothetical protein
MSYLQQKERHYTSKINRSLENKNEIGLDGLKQEMYDNDYNLELYGEFVPTLFSWIDPNEQMKRCEEITKDVD